MSASGKRQKPPEDEQEATKRSKTSEQENEDLAMINRSDAFITSLQLYKDDFGEGGALVPVENADDVWCLKDVVNITEVKAATTQHVVLSAEVIDFWDACIADAGNFHVCAKGSPGVGKSTTFCYVIRKLLRNGNRVIYLYRTPEKENLYHVWKMGSATKVHPETMSLRDVVAEYSDDINDLYYLCDAGRTQDSCAPNLSELNAVINASADDIHWGGREFIKRRTGQKSGTLLTFPMMTKEQIFAAHDKFPGSDTLTKATLEDRHRRFGSIPRNLFECQAKILGQLAEYQTNDIGQLTGEKVKGILNGTVLLNAADSNAPRSSIMCITGEPPLYLSKSSFVSDLVQEKVAARHMTELWNEIGVQDTASTRGHFFESYVRALFAGKSNEYRCRNAVGKSQDGYKTCFDMELGGASAIQRTHNMIKACKTGADGVIFYSFSEFEPLVDFMYKVDNEYYAIQATIGEKHDCDNSDGGKVDRFLAELDLQSNQVLNLLYAVPSGTFSKFTTKPANPTVSAELADRCYILHAEIPQPDPARS